MENLRKNYLRKTIVLFVLAGLNTLAMAQDNANTNSSLRPSFGLEYTGELQTDFEKSRMGNLLQLCAELPLSKSFKLNVSTVSFAATKEMPLGGDLQGYSNIDADNLPLALAVAGVTWNISDRHSLFAGVRRIDEDYFCSDALALFTNSSCGGFPTISANYDIAAYPMAAVGIHYTYDCKNLTFQTSLYNGTGHNRFASKENVFRVCPKTDGVFAIGQAEYRYHDSRYFVGASAHYGDLGGTGKKIIRPTAWVYAEQSVSGSMTLIAAYSRAFSDSSICRNFFGLGGKCSVGKAELGIFTDYTRMDGIGEWATELTCSYALTDIVSVQPVLHIIDTDNHTKCIGMLRLGISL